MQKQLEIIKIARKGLITILDELSLEEINKIPTGFNNNLAWQLGHVIAVQQGVCYGLSGNTPPIDGAFLDRYRKDTKPEGDVSAEDFEQMKEYSSYSLALLESDLKSDKFASFTSRTLGNGYTIVSIDDALIMLCNHEGMHLGYAQALKRAVKA